MIICGVIALIAGVVLAILGNNKNGDEIAKLEWALKGKSGGPGDLMLYIGIALAVIGVIVVVCAFLKKKKAQ